MDLSVIDAGMLAEAIASACLHRVLKGLHKSPRIVSDLNLFQHDDIISPKDISCLLIPDGCLGLPALAALEQGIKVIAVKNPSYRLMVSAKRPPHNLPVGGMSCVYYS